MPKTCTRCRLIEKKTVFIDGNKYRVCGQKGWSISEELAKTQAVCMED